MLALAIYFGDGRFERFIGTVRTRNQIPARRSIKNIRLEGRYDFVQHFVISMGRALTGGSEMANLIGDLKEMRNSKATSGFSVTDVGRTAYQKVIDEIDRRINSIMLSR